MPPLGRTLMGLWASEAYSFHPVSTSRFPSILFHNTPGDVYVLQDARKMRSRLHSDIGRFTASDEGWARSEEGASRREGRRVGRDERRKRRERAILAREIELGFARASRLLFASAIRRILRTERRRSRALSCTYTYLRDPDAKFDPKAPWAAFVQPGIGRSVLTWNRKGNKLFENCTPLNIDELRLTRGAARARAYTALRCLTGCMINRNCYWLSRDAKNS